MPSRRNAIRPPMWFQDGNTQDLRCIPLMGQCSFRGGDTPRRWWLGARLACREVHMAHVQVIVTPEKAAPRMVFAVCGSPSRFVFRLWYSGGPKLKHISIGAVQYLAVTLGLLLLPFARLSDIMGSPSRRKMEISYTSVNPGCELETFYLGGGRLFHRGESHLREIRTSDLRQGLSF